MAQQAHDSSYGDPSPLVAGAGVEIEASQTDEHGRECPALHRHNDAEGNQGH